MEKVKLCYVIVNCKITGPMFQTLNIIKNIDFDRFDVSIITLFPEESNNSMLDEYLKYCSYHICLGLNKFSSIIYGKYLLKVKLELLSPDIIHSLGMPPFRLTLAYKKAKHLVTLRNYPYEDYPTYYNKFLGPILAFFDIRLIKKRIKREKEFITCSKSLSEIYADKLKIKLDYIQNGVDNLKYIKQQPNEKLQLRKKLNLPIDAVIMIYVAPFIGRKNQEFAIKGILKSNIPNLYLVLCGEGNDFNNLYSKYHEYKQIIFTGKISNVSEYLRSADVYVSTSKSEGMPNSVLEAMSSGLGVLLSDIPQHLELFEINQNIGEIYISNNMNDFIFKIKKIIKNDSERIGNESYITIIENLTSKKMSEKYQKLYYELIGGSNEK